MIEKNLPIINKLGLHARAAARFVQLASTFDCQIDVSLNGKTVSGKSIMGMMMLAAAKGSTIKVCLAGPEEQAAADGLATLVSDRFGEDE